MNIKNFLDEKGKLILWEIKMLSTQNGISLDKIFNKFDTSKDGLLNY